MPIKILNRGKNYDIIFADAIKYHWGHEKSSAVVTHI